MNNTFTNFLFLVHAQTWVDFNMSLCANTVSTVIFMNNTFYLFRGLVHTLTQVNDKDISHTFNTLLPQYGKMCVWYTMFCQ